MVKKYIFNVLVAIDQTVNAICGGDPDETISSRIGKREDGNERFFAKVVDSLFFWDRNHTKKASNWTKAKTQYSNLNRKGNRLLPNHASNRKQLAAWNQPLKQSKTHWKQSERDKTDSCRFLRR